MHAAHLAAETASTCGAALCPLPPIRHLAVNSGGPSTGQGLIGGAVALRTAVLWIHDDGAIACFLSSEVGAARTPFAPIRELAAPGDLHALRGHASLGLLLEACAWHPALIVRRLDVTVAEAHAGATASPKPVAPLRESTIAGLATVACRQAFTVLELPLVALARPRILDWRECSHRRTRGGHANSTCQAAQDQAGSHWPRQR
mmetsp:Transcript_49040/g.136289  ORF Transcript_49040/g.136289 Transcript_49040/m.136289 type:complete len:203 (+) Transcript_49040:333-941(+)